MGSDTYHAFYRHKKIEITAETSYKAQQKAKEVFRAKNGWEIVVVLVAEGDTDTPVVHSTAEVG